MQTFAEYILSEKDWIRKMEIVHYLKKRTNIFFDNSVVLKTQILKMFLEQAKPEGIDENVALTACLLCNCKKNFVQGDLSKVKSYAKEGAEFLSQLGFDERFCKICEEVNRYSGSYPREKESDLLELVDQFGGMLMNRPERAAFRTDDALVLLEYRNLKGKDNRYVEQFKEFVGKMEAVTI